MLVNIGRIFYCVIHLHFTYLINFPEYKAAYCNRFSCRQYCYNTIGGRSLEKSIYHTGQGVAIKVTSNYMCFGHLVIPEWIDTETRLTGGKALTIYSYLP